MTVEPIDHQDDLPRSDEADEETRSDARRRRRRIRRRRFRRKIPPLSVVPTMITLGNLIAGFAAIHYAFKPEDYLGPWGWSNLTVAAALIFLGMALDAIDGSVARITRSHSDIGAQLDSLADLVTFGVAPAFMMLRLVSTYIGESGRVTVLGPEAENAFAKVLWAVAAAYVGCTALRLARFNVETPTAAVEDHLVFRGLPSPAAAGTVASLIMLHQRLLVDRIASPDDVTQLFARWWAFGVPLVTLLCAVAMISSVPYVHVINRYIRGQRSFTYVARMAILGLLAIIFFHEMLAIVFVVYTTYSPLRMTMLRLRKRLHNRVKHGADQRSTDAADRSTP